MFEVKWPLTFILWEEEAIHTYTHEWMDRHIIAPANIIPVMEFVVGMSFFFFFLIHAMLLSNE